MNDKNKKQDKKVSLKMSFSEALERLSKLDKKKVDRNMKNKGSDKDK